MSNKGFIWHKKSFIVLLSLLSGLLLCFSWPPSGYPFLIFFAFVPMLFISDMLLQEHSKVPLWQGIIYTMPGLLLWNAGTTWWIWNSTPPGAVGAIVLNSFFMSIVLGMWHCSRNQHIPRYASPIILIAFWMSWELLHLHWDLTWPWLNLGNVFASVTTWIQWYEYTGTFGGTLWIWVANFLVYYMIKTIRNTKKVKIIIAGSLLLWIIVPLSVSLFMYHGNLPKHTNTTIEAVVVQPNTDAWEEEYVMSHAEHIKRLLFTAKQKITPTTQLVVCPESALPHTLNEQILLAKDYKPDNNRYIPFIVLDSLIQQYPNLNFVLGLSTVKVYDYKVSSTCREVGDGEFRENYNTSCCYNRKHLNGLYHKSRLVPGVEKMPFPRLFGFLENVIIDLGGTTGSLGIDTMQRAFTLHFNHDSCKIGVPICYESIYGELFSRFVRNGAQLMCIITNDDWWGNTPGHVQHFLMSKLRAVESRRAILRSANTGISAVINERGDVLQQTQFKTRTALKQQVYPNDKITFYVKHGDYIARFALMVSAIAFLGLIILWIKKKLTPNS